MKKLLALLLLAAAPLIAQDTSQEKASQSVEKNAFTLGIQFVYDEGTVLDSTITGINFIGSSVTCVTNLSTHSADCTFTGGSSSTTIATDPIWTTAGDIVYGTGSATAVRLGIGGAHTLLHGGATAPAYSAVDLTADVTGGLPLPNVATQAANTAVANATSGTAAPTAVSLPSCVDSGGNHLNYTNGTGFSCGTTGNSSVTLDANGVLGRATNSSGAGGSVDPSTSYLGAPPQYLGFNGLTATKFQRLPWDTTTDEIIQRSFDQVATADGAAAINGLNVTFTGTSAGFLHLKNTATDANHINFLEMTTGTTTTGGATLGSGQSGAGVGFLLQVGSFVDWLVDVPVASGGTNTTRAYAGFCDTLGNSVCTNGALVSWDNNTDTHWAVTTVKAGVSTSTLNVASTTAATVGWHHLSVYFADSSHMRFYVDGVELSSSPLTTNLPTTVTVWPAVKFVASAGCAATSTCVIDVNTEYFHLGVAR